MRTFLVTQRDPLLLSKVAAICRGGIDAVQLRDKEAEGKDLFFLAQNLRKITWETQTALFINTRVDIAMAVQADGVHFPENHPIIKMGGLKIGVSVFN